MKVTELETDKSYEGHKKNTMRTIVSLSRNSQGHPVHVVYAEGGGTASQSTSAREFADWAKRLAGKQKPPKEGKTRNQR